MPIQSLKDAQSSKEASASNERFRPDDKNQVKCAITQESVKYQNKISTEMLFFTSVAKDSFIIDIIVTGNKA